MQDHRELIAFQKANEFVKAVYLATKYFPKEEQFGLTSQLRRAAVSVAANIVEGCGRNGQKELLNFLNIAFGSLRESGYYVELALSLDYLHEQNHTKLHILYQDTSRALLGLIRSVQKSLSS